MKKTLILITLIFLSSCTWNYKNWDIQKNIEAQEVQQLEKELLELEQKKAKEALEKIKLENEIASEVLDNFLKSEDFDIKAEIERTKQKYNDNLGPILEYEHEDEPEEKTSTWETLSGSTLTWSTLDVIIPDETELTWDDQETYSWEAKIVETDNTWEDKIVESEDKKIEEETTYNTQEKKWRSWTYTMYIWISDNCKWGLEMTDLENNKKWLFQNTCDKMIYNFELAVWWIKVYYNDALWAKNNEFVSIK